EGDYSDVCHWFGSAEYAISRVRAALSAPTSSWAAKPHWTFLNTELLLIYREEHQAVALPGLLVEFANALEPTPYIVAILFSVLWGVVPWNRSAIAVVEPRLVDFDKRGCDLFHLIGGN